MVTKGEGGGGREGLGFGIGICTLRYMEWLASGTCWIAQGTLANILWWSMWEKNLKRMDVCTCVCVFFVEQKLSYHVNQLYFHKTLKNEKNPQLIYWSIWSFWNTEYLDRNKIMDLKSLNQYQGPCSKAAIPKVWWKDKTQPNYLVGAVLYPTLTKSDYLIVKAQES